MMQPPSKAPAALDEREQKILRMRFGLDGAGEIRTLETWAPR